MSNSKDMIRELDEQAAKKEADFMNHIASRLQRSRITEKPQHPFRGAPDFWNAYELPLDKRVRLFMENWTGIGGMAERFSTMAGAFRYITDVVKTMQAKYIIRWDDPEFEKGHFDENHPDTEITVWNEQVNEHLISKAAGADIGIAMVDYAIAHTGTVVAMSGNTKGRSVSLLPTVFIAIVRAEDIKTRMGEVVKDLQARFGTNLPAGIHFITGPSRSSDIENDLTIGVHGPGIVYALVVG
ncbi:LutC/YkgG family protein [Aneurinibacillus terranovensis]|uniref:LutC/YkgG family protein n=1 Tax=Aneurinibacillus terranovensis TaxID=278991 RepID=UPI0004186A8E|nr:lactate utilization protein C [Aneurinibacillus terranovensis]